MKHSSANYSRKGEDYNGSLPDSIYWRYRKRTHPTEAFPGKNGPVIITKPASKPIKAPKDYPAKAEFGYGQAMQKLRDIMRED